MSTDFEATNRTLFGRRLQEERKTLGYRSQESLATAAKSSKRTITNWESGTSFPDASNLLTLAGLGFDIHYILFGVRSLPMADQNIAHYAKPAQQLASEIAGMQLSQEDADLLMMVARRLDRSDSE